MRRSLLPAGVLLGLCCAATPALANGRFPAADQILIDPSDPTHWLLRATYGLLQSHDAGTSWSWICEGAVGYLGDPALTLQSDGSLLAGYFGAVSVSSDQGCGWNTLILDVQHQYAIDATLDTGDRTKSWLLVVSVDGSRNVSLISVDKSATILETLPVGKGFVPTTVEVAPSKPERIYVTGLFDNGPAIVMRSDDRGKTWQSFNEDAYGALPLYISGVDPNNPDRVYARVDDTIASDGSSSGTSATGSTTVGSDHLLVSSDGGENWQTIFSPNTDLLGFALSPDGTRIAAGGPGVGVYLANTSDFDFQLAAGKVQVLRCLRWTTDGLFACGQESLDGWTLASSNDDAQSFTPLWHQQDLKPLQCGATTSTGSTCPLAWPDVAKSVGADPGTNANPAPFGNMPDPSLNAPSAPSPKTKGGCSFVPAPSDRSRSTPWLASGVAALALARARRRRHPSD